MSTSTTISTQWTKESLCKGDGFIIEGIIKSDKFHSVFLNGKQDLSATPLATRFICYTIEFDNAIKRNFKDGVEVPPKMTMATATAKGYLNNFDRVQANIVDKVDINAYCKAISGADIPIPRGFHDDALVNLHPRSQNSIELWADAEKFSHKDYKKGDGVRFKTIGNSIFVESIVKMDSNQISNFAGDAQLGQAWTSNIIKKTDGGGKFSTPNFNDQETNDDEWD
ncbi:hypothetical protein CYY_007406 [Polysphondylium violaceum]|uniref:Arpin n=1 Tax=Polysphondylium violaceum TaxID=133409 RepID=A0A8J4PRX4_9MYCE|nr:hypothetical protein CYY_007406 [Polysphondylium violaceum]